MKYIFLHIPKCAGTSMYSSRLMKQCEEIIHPIPIEGAISTIKEKRLEKHFKFAFTRNPWDRFVSLYFYFYKMDPNHFSYKFDEPTAKKVKEYKTFKDFCIDFQNLNHRKFHFFNQSQWTHDKNICFVDFIGKYENLTHDWKKLESIMGLKHETLAHVNKSSHHNYKKYYDNETIEIIGKIYQRDIVNFNYDF